MYSPYRPNRHDSKLDYNLIKQTYDALKRVKNYSFDPKQFLVNSDGSASFRVSINQAPVILPKKPFEIYLSPDATGDDKWHTIRVHTGTENGRVARATDDDDPDKFSDDSATYSNGAAKAIDMDMVLDVGDEDGVKTNYIVLVQERSIDGDSNVAAWAITDTYLCFDSQTPDGNLPFPGYLSGNPDVFKNVTYYLVGSVDVGSDAEEDDTYKQFSINQNLTDNFTTNFIYPLPWEPICTTDNSLDPADDDWLSFYIWNDGLTNPDIDIDNINDPQVQTAGVSNYFWLDYTLDEDTGAVDSMALQTGTTFPSVTTPDPGKAPADVYLLLATIEVPSSEGKSIVTMSVLPTQTMLIYMTVTIGWGVNEDGAVINDLSGIFY